MSQPTKLDILGITVEYALDLITQMESVQAILHDAIAGEGPICGDELECLASPATRQAAITTLRSTAARFNFIASRLSQQ